MSNAAEAVHDRLKRQTADRLRTIAKKAQSATGRALADVFVLGAAFEEAADLLRGDFTAWVKSECRIEPRTAFGYRKAHRFLGERKDWLVARGVSPSVVMLIAGGKAENRERALDAIASGRSLSANDVRAILRGNVPDKPSGNTGALKRIGRTNSDRLIAEIEKLTMRWSKDTTSSKDRSALVESARRLLPIASYLLGGSEQEDAGARCLRLLERIATNHPALERGEPYSHAVVETNSPRVTDRAAIGIVASPPPCASLHSPYRHGLTSLEICAGAGGLAGGLAQAGFRHVAMVEREPHACATLKAAFGGEHIVEADLTSYDPDPSELGSLDLLSGGPPCQPFSQYGKRAGPSDSRDMFPEVLGLIERLRPRALLLENVAGLFAPDFDRYRFRVLARLQRAGYACEWRKVDATHFGVPQKRIRTILVGFREPVAMARFAWPKPVAHYAEEPTPAIAAVYDHLIARGWDPPAELLDAMDRPAPTIVGGSERKASADFGKRKSAAVWGEMGFIQTRIGLGPPDADHEGPVEATNAMLARLQGFASDWPFQGSKQRVFKQIANALPPPVGLHLGCAVASALTGTAIDPIRYMTLQGMRSVHRPKTATKARAETMAAGGPIGPSDVSRRVRLELGRLSSEPTSSGEVSLA